MNKNKYFDFKKGNIPLIITVPHGGSLIPQDIQNRDFGSYKKDKNTILVLKDILREFNSQKIKPYYVCMNLHRRKIDVNRGSKEGAQSKGMLRVYKNYHSTVREMRLDIQRKFGAGMLIDLHGQKSKKGFIEIGYGVAKEELKSLHSVSEDIIYQGSSVGFLIKQGQDAHSVVFGPKSLGDLFLRGFKVYPSSRFTDIDDIHYNGVYTIQRHIIKRKNEKMFGANLELCYHGIRDTEQNRKKFAKLFVQAVIKYLDSNIKKQ